MSIFPKLAPPTPVEGTCTEGERRMKRRASMVTHAVPVADVATEQQRYAPDVQQPRQQNIATEPLPESSRKRRWIGPVLFGALIMLTVFLVGTRIVIPWVTDQIDHWNTGDARIWQCNLNVGHPGGTSHFVTQYYQDHVLVIEMQSSNPTNEHTYVIPSPFLTPPQTTPIITLQERDLNGDGKPDLLVYIEGVSNPIPLYNNGQTFQPDDPTIRKG